MMLIYSILFLNLRHSLLCSKKYLLVNELTDKAHISLCNADVIHS